MQLTQFTEPGEAALEIAGDSFNGDLTYYVRFLQDAPGSGRWFIVPMTDGTTTPCSQASIAQISGPIISGPGSPSVVIAAMPMVDALVTTEGVRLFWSPLLGVVGWLNPADWNSIQYQGMGIGAVGAPKLAGSSDFAVLAIRSNGVLSFAWLPVADLGGTLALYPVNGPNQPPLPMTTDPDIAVVGGLVVIAASAAGGGLWFFTPSSQSVGQPPSWDAAQITGGTFTGRPSIVAPAAGEWVGVAVWDQDLLYFCWQPAIGVLQSGWNQEQVPMAGAYGAAFGSPSAVTAGRSIVIVAAGAGQTLMAYWKQTDAAGLPAGDWTAEPVPLAGALYLLAPPSVAYLETAGPYGSVVIGVYLDNGDTSDLWTYWHAIDSDGMPAGQWIAEAPRRYGCAINQMLEHEAGGRADEVSAALRQLRDGTLAATPAGRWLIDLLDRHTAEFARMLDSDPGLSRSAWELLQQAEPISTSPGTTFADDLVTAAQQLLRRVHSLASPGCQESLNQLAERLPGLRGQTLADWLSTTTVPARNNSA